MTTTPPVPPEPQSLDDIRTLTEIAWAPRGCEHPSQLFFEECGRPATYRFGSLSPYGKTATHYACTPEHALAEAQGLWGIGHVIQ